MHHSVSFSGGVCSFWAAARVVERYGTENVTLLFADTKMEDEDLYRFMGEAVEYLGVSLTTIADGRTPWQVFSDEGFLGNSRVDLCSRILKRELLDSWHRANCPISDSVIYVGIDWTEEHRLHRLRARKPGWQIEAPMCEAPLWDKCRMTDELRKIGIEPPRLYKMGFPHNNCGGFCIKAGQAHFAHLLKTMPERYAEHEAKEEKMRARLGDVSIMKDRRGGTHRTLTMKMLRERIEKGETFDRADWGGCGCAIDAPEEAKKINPIYLAETRKPVNVKNRSTDLNPNINTMQTPNQNALIAIASAATALAAAATALVSGNTGEQAEPLKEDSTEVIPPTTTRRRGRPAASTEPEQKEEAPAPTPEPEKKETGKTLEQLRALIEPLVKGGQGDDVKKVIAKYAPKLSEIASKDHDAFTKDIEALSL